jgi:hypothetical protein
MRKNCAISGAPSQITAPTMKPNAVEARNAVLTWRGSRLGRCTTAGPNPTWEKLREKPMTTRAAPTRPKSSGDSSRVRRISTTTFSTAIAPLPQATQTMPLTARLVRLADLSFTCAPFGPSSCSSQSLPRPGLQAGDLVFHPDLDLSFHSARAAHQSHGIRPRMSTIHALAKYGRGSRLTQVRVAGNLPKRDRNDT